MAARGRKRFYVYVCEGGDVVAYVGKGCGHRHKQSGRKFGLPSRIIEWFDSEDDAFKRERELIAELMPTENKCPGGNGGRATEKPKTKEERRAEAEARKFERTLASVGSRRYCARFLVARLWEGNIAEFGVSKVDLNRLREVANGPWA